MSTADARAYDHALVRLYGDLRPELLPLLKLPPPDRPRAIRARMAEFLQHRFAATQQITREDLEAGGFTADEIAEHFHAAKRIARLPQMVS